MANSESPVTKEYGEHEQILGVGVNRDLQSMQEVNSPTEVHYNDTGGTVVIDLEHDEDLSNLISEVRESIKDLSIDEKIIQIPKKIIELTPTVDTTGEYHRQRALPLGVVLQLPVECVDRALFTEACFKSEGIDAKMLISVDKNEDGNDTNHTDIIFTFQDKQYVAITTGVRAGEVLSYEGYSTRYLQERQEAGLGTREIKDWGNEYFKGIKTSISY